MEKNKIKLYDHYRKVLYFAFNRFKNNNYGLMREYFANILINELEEFMPLKNKKILDVGGGRGEFCRIIYEKRGCDAINLDPYPNDEAWSPSQSEPLWEKTTIGFAEDIPFEDNSFDIVICRGVLEHIPKDKKCQCINEMYRVTKNGGICYIMIPPWYNPHGGHLLKPFHIFPFKIAKTLRQLIFRNKINSDSYEEEGLYPITFKGMLRIVS